MNENSQLACPRNRSRTRHVVEIVAPTVEPARLAAPPAAATRGLTRRKVLLRLADPVPVPALAEELGVSRQRVDQILKSLLKQGTVIRVPEPGVFGRWLWVRSEIDVRQCLRHYAPLLRGGQAATLNALAPAAFHSVADTAAWADLSPTTVAKRVRDLEARGLAVSVRLGRKRYVGITPKGLDHPSRTGSTARAAAADLSKAFGGKRVLFLETLAVLSAARTIDITAALAGAERPAKGLLSGQHVAWLLKSGLAEPLPAQDTPQPRYRLTEAGILTAALIARYRTPPDKAVLERYIAAYRSQKSERLRNRFPRATGTAAGSPAQQAILDALGAGPLSTVALRRVVAGHLRHPRSIQLMLQSLVNRGAVRNVGKDGRVKVWSVPCRAQHERAIPETSAQER